MASLPGVGKSVADWQPDGGKPENDGAKARLFNTEAGKGYENDKNEQKAFVGKTGKPSEPLGQKGRLF